MFNWKYTNVKVTINFFFFPELTTRLAKTSSANETINSEVKILRGSVSGKYKLFLGTTIFELHSHFKHYKLICNGMKIFINTEDWFWRNLFWHMQGFLFIPQRFNFCKRTKLPKIFCKMTVKIIQIFQILPDS